MSKKVNLTEAQIQGSRQRMFEGLSLHTKKYSIVKMEKLKKHNIDDVFRIGEETFSRLIEISKDMPYVNNVLKTRRDQLVELKALHKRGVILNHQQQRALLETVSLALYNLEGVTQEEAKQVFGNQ